MPSLTIKQIIGIYKVANCPIKKYFAMFRGALAGEFNQNNEEPITPAPTNIEKSKNKQEKVSQPENSSKFFFLKPKAKRIPAIVIKAADVVIIPFTKSRTGIVVFINTSSLGN